MKFIKKEIQAEKKYLCFGPVRIPYKTDRAAEIRKLTVGPFTFKYRYDEEFGAVYLILLGCEVPIKTGSSSRRLAHYQIREQLDEKKCKDILVNELTPLLGYVPNLDEPRSFNEKINWLKLHNHDPRITTCCDKYAVKEYAAQRIGAEHVLPVIERWENADEIDFDILPQKFVLKVNWSSGFNIIVKDKNSLDIEAVRNQIDKWMHPRQNSYYDTFNWGYRDMMPVVYAEPYIEQVDGQVYDYKFFFNYGKFLYMFIATDRHTDGSLTYTFFDEQFKPLPFTYGNKPRLDPPPAMPKNLYRMLQAAQKLAQPFPFVRVDFYEIGEAEFYLGEMTFYSGGGTLPFNPVSWDAVLGDKIDLEPKGEN